MYVTNVKLTQHYPKKLCRLKMSERMFSKTPRQTIFDTVSNTPGPGAYDPQEPTMSTKSTATFNRKNCDRLRRDDSNLSSCSGSTNGSGSSSTFRRPALPGTVSRTGGGPSAHAQQSGFVGRVSFVNGRLRMLEMQIHERDQIISRLRQDHSAATTRSRILFDAYCQLRRVSCQAIPSHRLPRDISLEVRKHLQEEKSKPIEELRPSMTTVEIQDRIEAFVAEVEREQNPEIAALEAEKASLASTLEEKTKEYALTLGRLSAQEAENRSLSSQLDRVTHMLDEFRCKATDRDEKLFVTLKELGEAKGQLASLEELRANNEQILAEMKVQLEETRKANKKLEEDLSTVSLQFQQSTAELRVSEDERERLARELSITSDSLALLAEESAALKQKASVFEGDVQKLQQDCSSCKSELSSVHEKYELERLRAQKAEDSEKAVRIEQDQMRQRLEQMSVEEIAHLKQDFERQMRQAQENFEMQLDEARLANRTVTAENANIKTELQRFINNVHLLESQVQQRDQLLDTRQHEIDSLEKTIQELELIKEQNMQELSQKSEEAAKLQALVEVQFSELETAREETQKLRKDRDLIVHDLQEQLKDSTSASRSNADSLQAAVDECAVLRERLKIVEHEHSQTKLLNLATTAELEQTKQLLQNAEKDSADAALLRSELNQLQECRRNDKKRLEEYEEELAKLSRVKDSLQQQLKSAEARESRLKQEHMTELSLRDANNRLFEEHLKKAKMNHEDELLQMRKEAEIDRQRLVSAHASSVSEMEKRFLKYKDETDAVAKKLHEENELLKTESEALINAKASLTLQLQARNAEILEQRRERAEIDFYSKRCQQLDSDIAALKSELDSMRLVLTKTADELNAERQANEAHTVFTYALLEAKLNDGTETLQVENDRLKHHLESVIQLLHQLETGIETSERQKSTYVQSLTDTQEQIRRLVGHQNSKQRIQYVGKLQTENRELKDEVVKLRGKVDAGMKRVTQLEQQLRRLR